LLRDFSFLNSTFSFSFLLPNYNRSANFKLATIGCQRFSELTLLVTHMSVQSESPAAENQSSATSSVGTQKSLTTTFQIFF